MEGAYKNIYPGHFSLVHSQGVVARCTTCDINYMLSVFFDLRCESVTYMYMCVYIIYICIYYVTGFPKRSFICTIRNTDLRYLILCISGMHGASSMQFYTNLYM